MEKFGTLSAVFPTLDFKIIGKNRKIWRVTCMLPRRHHHHRQDHRQHHHLQQPRHRNHYYMIIIKVKHHSLESGKVKMTKYGETTKSVPNIITATKT